MVAITGTLIWYYYICPRQVWLMSHQINPFDDHPLLELGRFIHDHSYKKEKKSIRLENMEIDLLEKKDGELIVGEVKKSSSYIKSATMQLVFYLRFLQDYGIKAKGELLFPKEKKRIKIKFDDQAILELEETEKKIKTIITSKQAPKPIWLSFCKPCAYGEFCWS